MECKPTIYVIIPVYKAEKYVAQTLDSVLSQPYPNIEIVCVDDGSPDDSISVLRRYEAEYPNVRILRQENSGVSVARNTGIDFVLSCGAAQDYLIFLDADDCWVRNTITAELVDVWAHTQVISMTHVFCSEDLHHISAVPAHAEPELLCGGADAIERLAGRHLGSALYQLDLVREYQFRFIPGLRYAEDVLFCQSCLYLAKQIAKLDKVLYLYRNNSDGAMSRAKSSIDHIPEIICAHLKTAAILSRFKTEPDGKPNPFIYKATIWTLELTMSHYLVLRSSRALSAFFRENPKIKTLLDEMVPEQYSNYHRNALELYRKARPLFIARQYGLGCLRLGMHLLKKFPIVRAKLIDRQYPHENSFL